MGVKSHGVALTVLLCAVNTCDCHKTVTIVTPCTKGVPLRNIPHLLYSLQTIYVTHCIKLIVKNGITFSSSGSSSSSTSNSRSAQQ